MENKKKTKGRGSPIQKPSLSLTRDTLSGISASPAFYINGSLVIIQIWETHAETEAVYGQNHILGGYNAGGAVSPIHLRGDHEMD